QAERLPRPDLERDAGNGGQRAVGFSEVLCRDHPRAFLPVERSNHPWRFMRGFEHVPALLAGRWNVAARLRDAAHSACRSVLQQLLSTQKGSSDEVGGAPTATCDLGEIADV